MLFSTYNATPLHKGSRISDTIKGPETYPRRIRSVCKGEFIYNIDYRLDTSIYYSLYIVYIHCIYTVYYTVYLEHICM